MTNRDCQLPSSVCGSDNRSMPEDFKRDDDSSAAQAPACGPFVPGSFVPGPFVSGSMVVVTLCNPRDKFWGAILALAPEGLSITGSELASFEDWVVMVKNGESFTPAIVFFPMHRIERIELDLPDGRLTSLSQRFLAKTGLDPALHLGSAGANGRNDRHTGSRSAIRPAEDPA
jgi:hypothetical protein